MHAVSCVARSVARLVAPLFALWLSATPCAAASVQFCDRTPPSNPVDQDILLRFGAVVKDELAASGRDVAIVARSGLDLRRLHVRYSHAGVALKDEDDLAWAVRQLYYACDERIPRVFDQGMAGFLLGTDDPQTGWITLLLLPPRESRALEAAARDRRQALDVLGVSYSADAYPYSTRYENCNQWVMELLATAWNDDPPDPAISARERAQRWLYARKYAPTVFQASARPLTWITWFVPWLHDDDHPPGDRENLRYTVSMPLSIETFVHRFVEAAERVELCHDGRHVVVHHGWTPIADGCEAGPGDREFTLGSE